MADFDVERLAREIRIARAAAGMTQEELGRLTELSRDQVANYENGRIQRPPRRRWIAKAVDATGHDGLWAAAGYQPPDGLFSVEGVADHLLFPDLRLTVSGRTWACDQDFMRLLADHRASRGDWEEACS